jgi:TonB family protein
MANNNKKISRRSLLISIVFHLLVVLIIVISFKQSARIFIAGNKPSQVINAYLPSVHALKVMTAKHDKVKIKRVSHPAITAIEKPESAKHPAQKVDTQKMVGQKLDPLIALLHVAIEQHERYPQSALEMGRAGRVTVEFRLFQDGSITDLKVLKASGTISLDQAALSAVKAAAPFKQVKQYLQGPKTFTLDIVFEPRAI